MTRHPADLLSLAFGLLFTAAGLVQLSGGLDALSIEWVAPVGAVVLGSLFVLAGRSGRATTDDEVPTA